MTCKIPPRSETPSGTAFVAAGEGEPLVLIHGVGLRLEAWEAQMATMSATHRVIALDMPGHGGSAPLPAGARLPVFVDWLRRVMDELGLDRANLAGHSMGALIVGGMVAEHPGRVARAALLCAVHRRTPEARAAVVARAEALRRGERDSTGPLARWFGEGVDDPACRRVRGWLDSAEVAGYATAYGAFATGDDCYADAWAGVAQPALFLTGAEDANSTPEMARRMAAAAPRGRAVVIECHGHMVPVTAPSAVNAALQDWLAEEVRS